MEDSELQKNWPEVKKRLKQQYPELDEEDLTYKIGQEGELLENLQRKLKKNWRDIKATLSLLG